LGCFYILNNPWLRSEGDKKRHSLLPSPFRTLSLASSPVFVDSALVLGVLDKIKLVPGNRTSILAA
jgi:hypothetical protein